MLGISDLASGSPGRMNKFILFAVVAIPVFMGNLDSTIVAVAFPTMVSHFGTSLVVAGWVMSVYILVSIGTIPVASRLSDTHGRRPVFIGCLILFTTGSFLCAIAPNIGWLIFFRMIQAVGGGGFISAATGIISDQIPDKRQQLIGLLASIANFGSIAGPNIGSVMVTYFGWRSVFWINVPIGVVAFVLCVYLIKKDTATATRSDLDFLGIGLLIGFISSFMVALTLMGHSYQVPGVMVPLVFALGLLLLLLFILRCMKRPGGVVAPELVTRRPFLAANLYNFIYGSCAQNGVIALVPLYATSVYGMSVIESGLMITPRSFGVILTSIIASIFIVKWGYRRPIIVGSLGMSLGLAVLALEPHGVTVAGFGLTPGILIMMFALLVGLGAGLVSPASNNACIELMPDKVSSITGLRQISRRMGGTFSIGVSTLILQSSASMAQGFTWVFMISSILMLLAVPVALAMPPGGRR